MGDVPYCTGDAHQTDSKRRDSHNLIPNSTKTVDLAFRIKFLENVGHVCSPQGGRGDALSEANVEYGQKFR
jgi:hypothetical protein